ncbi:hypothetical protein RP20_CCG016413 [Aedes albopictus]|nr:hypothetical protein RP20_CCG016413 [Aedes albopictus]
MDSDKGERGAARSVDPTLLGRFVRSSDPVRVLSSSSSSSAVSRGCVLALALAWYRCAQKMTRQQVKCVGLRVGPGQELSSEDSCYRRPGCCLCLRTIIVITIADLMLKPESMYRLHLCKYLAPTPTLLL